MPESSPCQSLPEALYGKEFSRIAEAIPETSGDLHRIGVMDDVEFRKIAARHLSPTASYISQLEPGTDQPKGSALALLNVIRRKGLEAMLWLDIGRESGTLDFRFPLKPDVPRCQSSSDYSVFRSLPDQRR